MITINARGARTINDARPLIHEGQGVYIVIEDETASLILAGRIAATRPAAEVITVRAAQDWAYEVIEAPAAEVITPDWDAVTVNAEQTPDLDAVADAVYAPAAAQIRENAEQMQAEAMHLAARAALGFQINGRTIPATDPRHPAQAAANLSRRAEKLIAWTARNELDYQDYISQGLADTDGHFAPLDRSSWI